MSSHWDVDVLTFFLQELLHATGLWYWAFASPSCALLIQRVGLLSNWKQPVGVSVTSLRILLGTDQFLNLFSVAFVCFYCFVFTHIYSSFAFFLAIRHRLEEGQASSWSRRLKFFMCCTRAQDTQSVSHATHLLNPFPILINETSKQKEVKPQGCSSSDSLRNWWNISIAVVLSVPWAWMD